MKIIFRTIFGVLHLLCKYVALVLITVIGFLWEFNTSFIVEIWKDHHIFYKSLLFGSESLEQYRYNTFTDFVKGKKDFSKKWTCE